MQHCIIAKDEEGGGRGDKKAVDSTGMNTHAELPSTGEFE